MTSIDFLNKVHKSLDSQEYSLSYSPAKSKNYMLYCNGNFIGGLFDEELCFVYADSVSELLGQPEPVYRGYSSTAQHRMQEREFVLLPLAEIAPALVLPCGTPLAQLVARCPRNGLAIIASGADEQEPL